MNIFQILRHEIGHNLAMNHITNHFQFTSGHFYPAEWDCWNDPMSGYLNRIDNINMWSSCSVFSFRELYTRKASTGDWCLKGMFLWNIWFLSRNLTFLRLCMRHPSLLDNAFCCIVSSFSEIVYVAQFLKKWGWLAVPNISSSLFQSFAVPWDPLQSLLIFSIF